MSTWSRGAGSGHLLRKQPGTAGLSLGRRTKTRPSPPPHVTGQLSFEMDPAVRTKAKPEKLLEENKTPPSELGGRQRFLRQRKKEKVGVRFFEVRNVPTTSYT